MSNGFGRKGVEPGQAVPASRAQGFGQNGAQAAQRIPAQSQSVQSQSVQSQSVQSQSVQSQSVQGQSEMDGLRNKNASEPRQQVSAEDIAQQYGYIPQPIRETGRPLWAAYLIWFFLGQLSIHRFYLGATKSAIYQLCLFFGSIIFMLIVPFLGLIGICVWGIWIIADLFLMPGLHRDFSRQGDPSLSFS